MGCPICLDAFGEDLERGTKPVALPCGHVFHKACSDGWLRTCRTKGDPANCPLCKKELGTAHALPLWLSDVSDLDQYLQHRQRRIEFQRNHSDRKPAPAALALDRYMSRDAQSNLLKKLIDFRQHINAYVMSVNNVSMSTYGGEERIFRLFLDMAKGEQSDSEEFKRALDALSHATMMLSDAVAEVETMRKACEEKQAKAEENLRSTDSMRSAYQKHMETKAREEQAMHGEKQHLQTLRLHLTKELQEVERRKQAMENERRAYINEAREKDTELRKAHLESAQIIAQSRGDAEEKASELNKYVQEQERLRIAAEDRSRMDRKKANFMADRQRLLSTKLDASRNENKRLLALIAELKGGEIAQQRTAKGKAKAHGGPSRSDEALLASDRESLSRYAKQEPLDDAQSERDSSDKSGALSKRTKEEWDDEDGQLEELRRKVSQGSSSGNGASKKTAPVFDTVVIEDEDIDAELDDRDYPMPVFSRTASGKGHTSGSGHSGGLLLPTSGNANGRRASNDDDMDSSVEFVSIKKPRLSSRARSSNGEAQPGRVPSGGSGMADSLPGNDRLIDRLITGGRSFLGPRRRIR